MIQEAAENQNDDGSHASWGDLFAWKKAVIIGCGLMFVQAITGINTVIFYSTTIFGFAGFHESILATVSVGLVNVLATLLSSYLVDSMGRKTLLLSGTYIMFGALMVLSMVLWIGDSIGESIQGIIAVLAVLVFVFGFAIGLGAVAWVGKLHILYIYTALYSTIVILYLQHICICICQLSNDIVVCIPLYINFSNTHIYI